MNFPFGKTAYPGRAGPQISGRQSASGDGEKVMMAPAMARMAATNATALRCPATRRAAEKSPAGAKGSEGAWDSTIILGLQTGDIITK
jgi:hypothetical protein